MNHPFLASHHDDVLPSACLRLIHCLLGIFSMVSDPSHKPGRCSPKCPEWAGCAVGCEASNNKLPRQISFQLSCKRGQYNFWRLQWTSPCTRACPRCPQNEVLDSHMLNPVMWSKWGLWLSKTRM